MLWRSSMSVPANGLNSGKNYPSVIHFMNHRKMTQRSKQQGMLQRGKQLGARMTISMKGKHQ